MWHSISEVPMQFAFPRTTISQVYREHQVPVTSDRGAAGKILWRTVHDLWESLNEIDYQNFLKFLWISKLVQQQMSAFKGPSLIWAFRAISSFVHHYWQHRTKYYTSSGTANICIGLLMIVNTLPGLTSPVSKCISWIDLYGDGEKLMDLWPYMSIANC